MPGSAVRFLFVSRESIQWYYLARTGVLAHPGLHLAILLSRGGCFLLVQSAFSHRYEYTLCRQNILNRILRHIPLSSLAQYAYISSGYIGVFHIFSSSFQWASGLVEIHEESFSKPQGQVSAALYRSRVLINQGQYCLRLAVVLHSFRETFHITCYLI